MRTREAATIRTTKENLLSELMRTPRVRSQLGAKLREMRLQAGFTLEEAAFKLDKSTKSLRRCETGFTTTDVHLARSMMDLYDIRDDTLLDEVRQASRRSAHDA